MLIYYRRNKEDKVRTESKLIALVIGIVLFAFVAGVCISATGGYIPAKVYTIKLK